MHLEYPPVTPLNAPCRSCEDAIASRKTAVADDWPKLACWEARKGHCHPCPLQKPRMHPRLSTPQQTSSARRRPEHLHQQTALQHPNHRLYAHHSNATGAAKLLTPISTILERVEGRKRTLRGPRPEWPPDLTPLLSASGCQDLQSRAWSRFVLTNTKP
jgi:hypothetical protein